MHASQAHLFQRLRWSLFRNSLRLLLDRSLVRGLTILFCSLFIWGFLFAVSWLAFHELKVRWSIPLDSALMERVFALLFLVLTIFLIFSTGIILYSSLFASPESAFLLSGPVSEDRIFAYKFQSAVAFSSWAFVLLGSPILIAYALEVKDGAPWFFYPVMALFFLGYVLIPGALGALAALFLVNFAPRRRKQLLIWGCGGVVAALILRAAFWLHDLGQSPLGSRAWFDSLIGELNLVRGVLLPFHWMARGLVAAARGEVEAVLYNLALVWSNGLFLFLLVAWAARRWFRRGFNLVATGGDIKRRYGGSAIDRALARVLFFLHPQTRFLIVKDFRSFRRDPAQLWQIIILLGLAGIYFVNMRWFYQQDIGRGFQNGVSLLTLTATAFWLCAYTGRFIFPLLSLEGRQFWILGLLPLDRERLLWGKFAFSTGASLFLALGLVVFSDWLLAMPLWIVGVHALTVTTLAVGLSGLSVGLGACLPNFRETDPSKIAVGFGGTLNLVIGLLYLVAVIAAMAAPSHLALALQIQRIEIAGWGRAAIAGAMAFGLGLGVLAVYVPLRAGARNLRRLEF